MKSREKGREGKIGDSKGITDAMEVWLTMNVKAPGLFSMKKVLSCLYLLFLLLILIQLNPF